MQAAIQREWIFFTELHELEVTGALYAKQFRIPNDAAVVQAVQQALTNLSADRSRNTYREPALIWESLFRRAVALASAHVITTGTRTLDILHCAAALELRATGFLTADARQQQFASAAGLRVIPF